MRLTKEEFKRIRPIEWVVRDVGGQMYNVPINQTFTKLFWLDFMRNVFAPKFKQQNGITAIATFDLERMVMLTDDLELELPTPLETAMYYANNADKLPINFMIPVLQIVPFALALMMLCVLLVVAIFVRPRDNSTYRLI